MPLVARILVVIVACLAGGCTIHVPRSVVPVRDRFELVSTVGNITAGPRYRGVDSAVVANDVEGMLELLSPAEVDGERIEMALSNAASRNKSDCLQALLQRGVDPNMPLYGGPPALHLAVDNGSAACAELMLQHGADPNLLQGDAFTPLHKAAMFGHDSLIPMLLAAGADPSIPSAEGLLYTDYVERRHRPLADAGSPEGEPRRPCR